VDENRTSSLLQNPKRTGGKDQFRFTIREVRRISDHFAEQPSGTVFLTHHKVGMPDTQGNLQIVRFNANLVRTVVSAEDIRRRNKSAEKVGMVARLSCHA
jgi:hypothetical protein